MSCPTCERGETVPSGSNVSEAESSVSATPLRETIPSASFTLPNVTSRVRRVPFRFPFLKSVTRRPSLSLTLCNSPHSETQNSHLSVLTVILFEVFLKEKSTLPRFLKRTVCVGRSQKLPFSILISSGVITVIRKSLSIITFSAQAEPSDLIAYFFAKPSIFSPRIIYNIIIY